MTEPAFDLVVVGSGGAAMSAAITARQAGKSVLLIERGTLGGTCVNVGCVPSKALLRFSGQRAEAAASPFAGSPTSAGPLDWAALLAQKDELVAHLREDKYAAVAAAYGFEVRSGTANFDADGAFTVDG
ncbi:MAG: FAD-dependent oxidoreductase, partial [Mycobacteriales bacterium]